MTNVHTHNLTRHRDIQQAAEERGAAEQGDVLSRPLAQLAHDLPCRVLILVTAG